MTTTTTATELSHQGALVAYSYAQAGADRARYRLAESAKGGGSRTALRNYLDMVDNAEGKAAFWDTVVILFEQGKGVWQITHALATSLCHDPEDSRPAFERGWKDGFADFLFLAGEEHS